MRPLLLPGLLDAARHNAAHGRADVALFESAHVYRPKGTLAPAWQHGVRPLHTSATHICAVLTQAAPPGWRSAGAPADFYAAKGAARGAARRRRVSSGGRARRAAVPAPGAGATSLAATAQARLDRRTAPAGRARLGSRPAASLRDRRRPAGRGAARPASFKDVTSFPAVLQDIAVVVGADVPAADVEARCARAVATCCARSTCSTSTTASRWGRQQVARAAARVPREDRTLTDEDVAGLRAAIEERLGEIGGQSPCLGGQSLHQARGRRLQDIAWPRPRCSPMPPASTPVRPMVASPSMVVRWSSGLASMASTSRKPRRALRQRPSSGPPGPSGSTAQSAGSAFDLGRMPVHWAASLSAKRTNAVSDASGALMYGPSSRDRPMPAREAPLGAGGDAALDGQRQPLEAEVDRRGGLDRVAERELHRDVVDRAPASRRRRTPRHRTWRRR